MWSNGRTIIYGKGKEEEHVHQEEEGEGGGELIKGEIQNENQKGD